MEGQRLHDLVAVGGARLQLEFQRVCAGRELARPGQRLPERAVVGQAFAEQARLRDERALGIFLQQQVRPGLVLGVAMLVQRDLGDDRAGGIDVGASRGRSGSRSVSPVGAAAGAAFGFAVAAAPGAGVAEGTGDFGATMPGAVCVTGGGGGRCSRCHASHRNSAENEKMTKRIRRWVSMTAEIES